MTLQARQYQKGNPLPGYVHQAAERAARVVSTRTGKSADERAWLLEQANKHRDANTNNGKPFANSSTLIWIPHVSPDRNPHDNRYGPNAERTERKEQRRDIVQEWAQDQNETWRLTDLTSFIKSLGISVNTTTIQGDVNSLIAKGLIISRTNSKNTNIYTTVNA